MREQTYLTGRQDNPELRRGYFTSTEVTTPPASHGTTSNSCTTESLMSMVCT